MRRLQMGDVLVVLLPEHRPPGHEQMGRRPAVVVGIPDLIGPPRFPVILVAPMTTAAGPWVDAAPDLYPVLEQGEGNLPRRSVVLLDQIRAVDAWRVEGCIGTLPEDRIRQIRSVIARLFGLNKRA